MRTADADILIVADSLADPSEHWSARWGAKLPTARHIVPPAAVEAAIEGWADSLLAAVAAARRPVVIVAYDRGVFAVAAAAARTDAAGTPGDTTSDMRGKVAGAFLVAPPAPTDDAIQARLPFPAVLVASRNDPHAPYAVSEVLAAAWGAELVDAGASGHLDGDSGHGPWPEGLMRFAGFLKNLSA